MTIEKTSQIMGSSKIGLNSRKGSATDWKKMLLKEHGISYAEFERLPKALQALIKAAKITVQENPDNSPYKAGIPVYSAEDLQQGLLRAGLAVGSAEAQDIYKALLKYQTKRERNESMKKKTTEAAVQFEQAIKAKEREIAEVQAEKETAAGDALQLVAIEKRERKAAAELEALQTAYKAATYKPAELTDKEELLQGIRRYQTKHRERIDSISAQIGELDRKAEAIERDLQTAAEQADMKATVKLSGEREETAAAKRHLLDMLQRARELPVYPDGAIMDEWRLICETLKPEWDNKILEIRTLAAAYTAAAGRLISLQSYQKAKIWDKEILAESCLNGQGKELSPSFTTDA